MSNSCGTNKISNTKPNIIFLLVDESAYFNEWWGSLEVE
jgi:hypothetical protein